MHGGPARLIAAAGSLLLAAAALRTVRAEAVYDFEGLQLASDPETSPAADLPGRLEAYEEAARRDPGEALYALRIAQIHLRRATARGASARRAELDAARDLLERAAD